ncbi:hypothetical protein SEPCBS119000_002951 [Sporothrix epigloea]|uniref:Uncharacterized protein n=1 Tax=Sporothrix epigloea TaxID=1892477 RepID=A0ABP0DLQ1_9PEZI
MSSNGSTPSKTDSPDTKSPLPIRSGFGSDPTAVPPAGFDSFRPPSTSSSSSGLFTPGSSVSGMTGFDHSPASVSPSRLPAQHERLVMELFHLTDVSKFRDFLTSIEGNWQEYCRDYLDRQNWAGFYTGPGNARETPDKAPGDPEPDKLTTATRADEVLSKHSEAFLRYHPIKTGWTPEDHAVRFIATTIADGRLRKVWTDGLWTMYSVGLAKAVYEVLCYKRTIYADFQQRWYQQKIQAQPESQTQPQDIAPSE